MILWPGPGASYRQAADRDVPSPAETDQLRGLYWRSVHSCAFAGQSLHAEDRGLQPPYPVSTVGVYLCIIELQPIKMQSEALAGQMQFARMVQNYPDCACFFPPPAVMHYNV